MHYHTANWCIQRIRSTETTVKDLQDSLENRHAPEEAVRQIMAALECMKQAREEIVKAGYEH